MNLQINSRRAVVIVQVALVVIALGSCLRWKASHDRATIAAANLAESREIAERIVALRQSPSQASADVQPLAELSRRIEQAIAFADVPLGKVLQIEPQPARRIPDSPYIRHSTRVELELVSLQQLITFLVSVAEADSRLQVTGIDLQSPPDRSVLTEGPETWNSEVILSYLVFSPRDTARRGTRS